MGYDFATILSVQSMVDVLEDFVVDWRISTNPIESWKVELILLPVTKEAIEQRYEEFDKRWKSKGRKAIVYISIAKSKCISFGFIL